MSFQYIRTICNQEIAPKIAYVNSLNEHEPMKFPWHNRNSLELFIIYKNNK